MGNNCQSRIPVTSGVQAEGRRGCSGRQAEFLSVSQGEGWTERGEKEREREEKNIFVISNNLGIEADAFFSSSFFFFLGLRAD